MGNIELNFLAELLEMRNDPNVTDEEITELLEICPDSVIDAYDIITSNRLDATLRVVN